jgi:hypothetical protein
VIKAESSIVLDAPVDAVARYSTVKLASPSLKPEPERLGDEVVPERSGRLGEFGAA